LGRFYPVSCISDLWLCHTNVFLQMPFSEVA
jgi:hypothetical protein